MSYQSSELAALEARIKAAEMLLRERKKDAGIEDDTPEEPAQKPEDHAKVEETPAPVTTKPKPAPESAKEEPEPEEEGVEEESEEEEPEPPRRSKRRSKYVPGINWSIGDYDGKRQYQIRPPPPPPAVPSGI